MTKDEKSSKYLNIDYNNILAIKTILRHYHDLTESMISGSEVDIGFIMVDIKVALEYCKFTKRQEEVLSYYMLGFSERQIGFKLNITKQCVNKHLKYCCRKISERLEKGAVL